MIPNPYQPLDSITPLAHCASRDRCKHLVRELALIIRNVAVGLALFIAASLLAGVATVAISIEYPNVYPIAFGACLLPFLWFAKGQGVLPPSRTFRIVSFTLLQCGVIAFIPKTPFPQYALTLYASSVVITLLAGNCSGGKGKVTKSVQIKL
jgi:hypothetical protein